MNNQPNAKSVPKKPIILVKFSADNQDVQEGLKTVLQQGDFPSSLVRFFLAKAS
ncbi:hypothetical protein [Hymenobacter arcticus]